MRSNSTIEKLFGFFKLLRLSISSDMYAHRAILIVLLVSLDYIWSEWIEMPQFSDDTKIYRTSFVKRYNSHKDSKEEISNRYNESQNANFTRYYNMENGTFFTGQSKDYEIGKSPQDYPITRLQIVSPAPSLPKSSTDSNVENFTNMVNADLSSIAEITSKSSDSNDAKGDIVTSDDINSASIQAKCNVLDNGTTISTGSPCSTKLSTDSTVINYQLSKMQSAQSNVLGVNSTKLLEYLPINILQSAHHRLRSQAMNLDMKMVFLKTFEATVMNEIESQLAKIFTPERRVRGITERYDHNYDEHDDQGVGFPSIEGALMAISFLTFAVYLVRLVMLLFQNMNNSVVTPTAATVFLGKRKRSVDQISYETLKLLTSIEDFLLKS